jgi:large-conductance mechanosensitive channel
VIDIIKNFVDCGVKTLKGDVKACPCKFNISILCGFNWQLFLFIAIAVLLGGAVVFILVMKFANTPFKSAPTTKTKTAKKAKKEKEDEDEDEDSENESLVNPGKSKRYKNI